MAKVNDHSAEYMRQVNEAIEGALEAVGSFLSDEAADELENSPRRVDTGLLRNSVTYALDGDGAAVSDYHADSGGASGSYRGSAPKEGKSKRSVIIGTNVEYALYVHEGTSRMAPNRFIKNAYERNKDQVEKYIKDAMNNP